ncbi:hypothetical protein [Rothia sp. HMSC065G12]|uniref:hypothetical protein n=1 Tax=Rothia sp. HMSC065G12 TaxID=1739308 RepID=UPI0008A622F3|nr:hypothetical protein [Rothia sp. HMSC065G12]OFK73953.1 hypothetical protein HMPREF2804_05685 [Rothia sp. HMSC065G12]
MQESLKVKDKSESQQNQKYKTSPIFRGFLYSLLTILKENWHIIAAVSFSYMVFISRNIYSELFSGNVDVAIEFTQAYYLNNLYRVILYFCVYVIYFAGMIISLSCIVSDEDIKIKYILDRARVQKWPSWRICFLKSFYGSLYFMIVVYIVLYLTKMFTFKTFLKEVLFYVIVFMVSIVAMLFLNLLNAYSMKKTHEILSFISRKSKLYRIAILLTSRKFIVSFCVFLILAIITFIPSCSVVSYGYIDVAYRKGYISCISSEDGSFSKNGIPVSYDSRGVNVFTGEYYLDESLEYFNGENVEKGYRWRNIHREYLQFEKGYKVTSGACNSGSGTSSAPPPQGQQIP